MMKRIFIAILATIYLSTSIGATVQLHYCMGRMVKLTLRHNNNPKCNRCGMEKKAGSAKGCCRDEFKHIKIDNDQKPSENYIQLNATATEIILIDPDYSILFPLSSCRSFTQINAPPPLSDISLNILHCVFRI